MKKRKKFYQKILERQSKNQGAYDFASPASLITVSSEGIDETFCTTTAYVTAPVLTAFVVWVLKSAREKGIRDLLFAARDGLVMYKIARKLCELWEIDMQCKYLYVSRYALRRPMYVVDRSSFMDMLCDPQTRTPTGFGILGTAGLTLSQAKEILSDINLQGDKKLTAKEIVKLKCKLEKNRLFDRYSMEAARVALLEAEEYLRENLPMHFAIVDSGWYGTIQECLTKLCDRLASVYQIHGYYFGRFASKSALPFDSFYFSPCKNFHYAFGFCVDLFEAMCAADHGKVLGYERKGEKWLPILDSTIREGGCHWDALLQISICETYAIRFAKLNKSGFKGVIGKNTLIMAHKLLRSFMHKPTQREAEVYGQVRFSSEVYGGIQSNLATALTTKELKQSTFTYRLGRTLTNKVKLPHIPAYWLQGNLVLSKASWFMRLNVKTLLVMHWLKLKLKRQKNKRVDSKTVRLRVWGYNKAEKLGVLSPARRLYRFVTGNTVGRHEINAQVNASLQMVRNDSSIVSENTILFFGHVHPCIYKTLNYIAEAMPKHRWLYFAPPKRNVYRKIWFETYPLPDVFGSWSGSDGINIKVDECISEQIACNEYLNLTVMRMVKKHPKLQKGFVEYLVWEMHRYYSEVLSHVKPSLIMLWSQYQSPHCVIHEIAKNLGIPVVFMESGVVPGTYYMDEVGQYGASWVSQEPSKLLSLDVSPDELEFAESLIKKLYTEGSNRYEQKQSRYAAKTLARLNKDRKTVFFAGDQDSGCGNYPFNDYSRKYCSPMFETSIDALRVLSHLAAKNDWNIIYKPNPLAYKAGSESKGKLPTNVCYISEGDINKIIDSSDLVVGITTSVTYLALIRGKPALTLGYTSLRGKNCVYEAFDVDSIEKEIINALSQSYNHVQKQAFIKHVAQMNKYYLFDNMDDRSLRYGRKVDEAAIFLSSLIKNNEVC